ncbi:MAG: PEP-CTERM sorting domain-containing protein [Gammaproteobacteria bacterium]|nr:MAG: PEP-CTERM sorting domain-containing protein [Gammaproteobacteria bacterium]
MKNRNLFLFHIPIAMLVAMFMISTVQAKVITGTIKSYFVGEAPVPGTMLFSDGVDHMFVPWTSTFSIDNPLVFFFGSNDPSSIFVPSDYLTDVGFAAGITDISQITDASIFSFFNGYIGPNKSGDFVVVRNTFTGHYGALRIDSVESNNTYFPDGLIFFGSILNGTWWIQTDGTGNFSSLASPVPEPSAFMLLSIGVLVLLSYCIRLNRNKLLG